MRGRVKDAQLNLVDTKGVEFVRYLYQRAMRYSQVYIDFYELHQDSYDSIIQFYEHHESSILELPLNELLELQCEYLNACFETAQYETYLRQVDNFIETLIMENMDSPRARSEYMTALFRKSAALFNLERYSESLHIAKQVYSMQPRAQCARILLRRNLYQALNARAKYLRYGAGGALLLAAAISGINLMLNTWLPMSMSTVLHQVSLGLLILSLIVLCAIEVKIRLDAEKIGMK